MYFKVSETQSSPAGPTSLLLQPHNTEDTKKWTDIYTIFQMPKRSLGSVTKNHAAEQRGKKVTVTTTMEVKGHKMNSFGVDAYI